MHCCKLLPQWGPGQGPSRCWFWGFWNLEPCRMRLKTTIICLTSKQVNWNLVCSHVRDRHRCTVNVLACILHVCWMFIGKSQTNGSLRLMLRMSNVAVIVTQLWRREQCNSCPLNANSETDTRGQITLTLYCMTQPPGRVHFDAKIVK